MTDGSNFVTPQDFKTIFDHIYPNIESRHWDNLLAVIETYKAKRPASLKQLDLHPQWFQQASMVGMTLYVDLFSGSLKQLITKVDYFDELGITYIHLMPLLKTREGNNDGGYAVSDYKEIEPKLGTMEDFEAVIQAFRKKNIAIAIDFVINHTAKEHRWAQAALKGDPYYQAYYMMFDDETIPNEFNKTVPEVLPDIYPGNFTYYPEIKKYVFKSFSEFQWDLNFANPQVLIELIDIFLFLANKGVAMIRLDAIPFIWKTLGTTCRNLPQAHEFIALFQKIKQYVCPGVAILGEAIVEPHEIYRYFGSPNQPECDVLYNATLMVNIWEALATQDGRLLKIETDRFPLPQHATWINYVRCHDDIGWGFNEQFIKDTFRDPYAHKQFLISFYNGTFPGSFARGKNYQENHKTHDARTNGTLAALIGYQKAYETNRASDFELAFARFKLIHHLLYCLPGTPLIYSGDEWLQHNDDQHHLKPGKQDGRWIHRPFFDWDKVNNKTTTQYPIERQAYQYVRQLNQLRKKDIRFSAQARIITLEVDNHHVFAFQRHLPDHPPLYCVNNFSNQRVKVKVDNFPNKIYRDVLTQYVIEVNFESITLEPYQSMILEERP